MIGEMNKEKGLNAFFSNSLTIIRFYLSFILMLNFFIVARIRVYGDKHCRTLQGKKKTAENIWLKSWIVSLSISDSFQYVQYVVDLEYKQT